MKTHRDVVITHNGARPILADLYIQQRTAPLILFCHGFKGLKDWGGFNKMSEYLAGLGYHVVKFNFSHNGGTAQQVVDFPDLEAFASNTYSHELHDIDLVIKALKDHEGLTPFWKSKRCVIIGHSRGGSMAILSAQRNASIHAVITLSAVSDLEARFQSYDLLSWREEGRTYITNSRTCQDMPLDYGFYEDFLSNRDSLDVKKAAMKLKLPVLVVHTKDDPVVSYQEAIALHELTDDSELFLTSKGGHTFGMQHPWTQDVLPESLMEVLNRMEDFLERKIRV